MVLCNSSDSSEVITNANGYHKISRHRIFGFRTHFFLAFYVIKSERKYIVAKVLDALQHLFGTKFRLLVSMVTCIVNKGLYKLITKIKDNKFWVIFSSWIIHIDFLAT